MWSTIVVATCVSLMLVSGTSYCFGILKPALSQHFQRNVEILGTIVNFGKSFGFIGAALLHRVGCQCVCAISAIMFFISYLLMVLTLSHQFTDSKLAFMGDYSAFGVYYFIVGQAGFLAFIASMQMAMNITDSTNRGKVVGIIDAGFGASALLFDSIFAKLSVISSHHLQDFFVACLILCTSITLLGSFIFYVHAIKSIKNADEAKVPLFVDNIDDRASFNDEANSELDDVAQRSSHSYSETDKNILEIPWTRSQWSWYFVWTIYFSVSVGTGLTLMNFTSDIAPNITSLINLLSILTATASVLSRLFIGIISDTTQDVMFRFRWLQVTGLFFVLILTINFWSDSVGKMYLVVLYVIVGVHFGSVWSLTPTILREKSSSQTFAQRWTLMIFVSAVAAQIIQYIFTYLMFCMWKAMLSFFIIQCTVLIATLFF